MKRLALALLIVIAIVVPLAFFPAYHVVFINDTGHEIILDIKVSDGSGKWTAKVERHMLVTVSPNSDAHLEINVVGRGRAVSTNAGYFTPGGSQLECYRIGPDHGVADCGYP